MPVSVVYSPSEIKMQLNHIQIRILYLIDTAGRSHKNKAQFEELKALDYMLQSADEIYLVLSLQQA